MFINHLNLIQNLFELFAFQIYMLSSSSPPKIKYSIKVMPKFIALTSMR
jgi:hypothetical protein